MKSFTRTAALVTVLGLAAAPSAFAAPRTGGVIPSGDSAATTTQAASTPASDSTTTVSETKSVKLTHRQTRSVQRRVHVHADGKLGSHTRHAISRYQHHKHLKRTGRPNIETLRAMHLKLADRIEAKLRAAASEDAAGGDATTAAAAAAVAAAREQIGVPYARAGNGPSGFDCSGLTVYVYRKAGVTLPRTSFDQYKEGQAVEKDAIQPGDLVFFSTDGAGASHVGIATSPTKAISATTRGVMEHSIDDSYWGSHYLGARRIATS